MGSNPAECIRYPGGYGFYFDRSVDEALEERGVEFSQDDLEQIFEPFLDPRIRMRLQQFQRPRSSSGRLKCDLEQVAPGQRSVHIFDARRLYYLRFGRIDSGELGGRHWKWLNVFLCKSRDEIESVIDEMEIRLPPGEYATYVYSSLGVPLFFPQHLRDYPTALDQQKLDGFVTDELCRLNSDDSFFIGIDERGWNGLHPYLSKYAWLYFDSEFQTETWAEGFWSQHSFNRPAPPSRPSVSTESAYGIFGITAEQFHKMSKKELTRLYRRKAKKMHPDRGGDHDEFVKLSLAYERLLPLKGNS